MKHYYFKLSYEKCARLKVSPWAYYRKTKLKVNWMLYCGYIRKTPVSLKFCVPNFLLLMEKYHIKYIITFIELCIVSVHRSMIPCGLTCAM